MILTLQRRHHDHICTMGDLFCGDMAVCTMEFSRFATGQHRGVRIQSKQYEIMLDDDPHDPVNDVYATRFGSDFHCGMLCVPTDTGKAYITMGNYPTDIHGNIIIGLTCEDRSLGESQTAYEMLYPIVSAAIKAGKTVMLDVKEETK